MAETGKYMLNQTAYMPRVPGAAPELLGAGTIVFSDLKPGPHMDAADDQATANKEQAGPQSLDWTGRIDMGGGSDEDILATRVAAAVGKALGTVLKERPSESQSALEEERVAAEKKAADARRAGPEGDAMNRLATVTSSAPTTARVPEGSAPSVPLDGSTRSEPVNDAAPPPPPPAPPPPANTSPPPPPPPGGKRNG